MTCCNLSRNKKRKPTPQLQVAGSSASKEGFTIVEVLLVLGITGLMLVGLIASTFTAIARQRYNDAIRSLSEYIQRIYGEVQSPQSYGLGNSDTAVLGKMVVFGSNDANDDVYSATVVGKADIPSTLTGVFTEELKAVNAQLMCGDTGTGISSSVDTYTPLWEAKILAEGSADKFKGTFLILRAPSSGSIHTMFTDDVYDLKTQCSESNRGASTLFNGAVQANLTNFRMEKVGFCVKTVDNVFVREIQITADARNTSGISILTDGESKCVQD